MHIQPGLCQGRQILSPMVRLIHWNIVKVKDLWKNFNFHLGTYIKNFFLFRIYLLFLPELVYDFYLPIYHQAIWSAILSLSSGYLFIVAFIYPSLHNA